MIFFVYIDRTNQIAGFKSRDRNIIADQRYSIILFVYIDRINQIAEFRSRDRNIIADQRYSMILFVYIDRNNLNQSHCMIQVT